MVRQVHHYCSASVFLSLISKKEIWLTSLSQSNDHLEGYWMLRYWLGLFNSRRGTEEYLKMRGAQEAVRMVINSNVALGTCFSEDGDLLSQWRGYASDGAGFSVALDKDGLEALASEVSERFDLSMSRVFYGDQDAVRISEMVRELHDAFGDDASKYQESSDGVGVMSLQFTPEKHQKQKKAAKALYTVKNGAFAEEKEWRLFCFEQIQNLDGLEFRESRGALSPFLRLKIPSNLIVGVTLGPTNKTPLQMVEEALKIYGIRCHVAKSKASYRAT